MGIVEAVEGERLETTFPVLGSEETAGLRIRMAELAEVVAAEIATDVTALAEVLTDQGLARCVYAVLFDYVIDGLIWDRLRDEVCVKLTMVWTDKTVRALNRLAEAPALRAVSRGSLPREGLVADGGEVWTLFDDEGRPTIPVIRRQDSDPVHRIGLRIAGKIVSALARDSPQAGVVVAAHELIWSVVDALEMAGMVRRPGTFEGAGSLAVQMFLSVDGAEV